MLAADVQEEKCETKAVSWSSRIVCGQKHLCDFSVVACIQGKMVYRIMVVRMMDLRKIVLTQLEQGSVDVLTLHKKLNVDFTELVNELNILLEAGYVTKTDDSFHLTERGRQYLEVEKKSGS